MPIKGSKIRFATGFSLAFSQSIQMWSIGMFATRVL